MKQELTWRLLTAMYKLYEHGKVGSSIANKSPIKYLLNRGLIEYQYGNSQYLKALPAYKPHFEKRYLQDFLHYQQLLASLNLEVSGRKTFTLQDIQTLAFIAENKEELKRNLTTRRTFCNEVFKYGGSKYLESYTGLDKAVRQILEIEEFPSDDPKSHQWRLVIDCPSAQHIVLCENLNFLKTPRIARENDIELWYVGGNNTKNVHQISKSKLSLPLFYSCDWDHHGLHIYTQLVEIFRKKSKEIHLLYPSHPHQRFPVNSPNHNSKWNPNLPFSDLDISLFHEKEIFLIKELIAKDQWIEEESNDLLEMMKLTPKR